MNKEIMICRAIRPDTKTWITVRIPPEHSAIGENGIPTDGIQYVLDQFQCQFVPMSLEVLNDENLTL